MISRFTNDHRHVYDRSCLVRAPVIYRNPQSRTVPEVQNTLYLETALANVIIIPSKVHQRLSAP